MKLVTIDNSVFWLIHADWYLVAGWVIALGIAGILTFASPATLRESPTAKGDELPPTP